jgi:hypothetical protein
MPSRSATYFCIERLDVSPGPNRTRAGRAEGEID